MNNLRLFLAFSFLIVFFGCVENEIERYEVQISVEPQGSASISPEIYGASLIQLFQQTKAIKQLLHSQYRRVLVAPKSKAI